MIFRKWENASEMERGGSLEFASGQERPRSVI